MFDLHFSLEEVDRKIKLNGLYVHRHELGGNFGNKQTKRAQDKTPPLLSTVFIRKNNKKKIFQLKSTQWEVCSLVTNTTILRISLGVNWTIAKLLVEWLHRLSRITNTCFANSTISYVYFLFDKRFGFLVQSKVLSLAFFYRDSNIYELPRFLVRDWEIDRFIQKVKGFFAI